jgi:predicted nucleotidyltransferase
LLQLLIGEVVIRIIPIVHRAPCSREFKNLRMEEKLAELHAAFKAAPSAGPILDILDSFYKHSLSAHILNIYLWGSRAYGTASEASDYDLMVVVDDVPGIGARYDRPTQSYHFDDYTDQVLNAHIVSLRHFQTMIDEHRHEAMECVFLPRQFVLLQRVKPRVHIDSDLLRRVSVWEARQRSNIAKSKWHLGKEQKDFYSAKKDFVHSLRYMIFAREIITHHRIEPSAANELYHRFMQHEVDMDRHAELFAQLKQRIDDCGIARIYERREMKQMQLKLLPTRHHDASLALTIREDTPSVLARLLRDDITMLQRLHITAQQHPHLQGLLHFVYTSCEATPYSAQADGLAAQREAQGLVINLDGEVMCATLPPLEHTRLEAMHVDAMPYLDGHSFNLWYHNGWQLSTKHSPIADGLVAYSR